MNRRTAWTGRDDGPGPAHRRFWSTITDSSSDPVDAALIGFASEEGVLRNQGRAGAVAGPAAIREALASLAVHRPLRVLDAGDVLVENHDLEGGQAELGRRLAELRTGRVQRPGRSPDPGASSPDHPPGGPRPLTGVLGGGHETAWGSYLGLAGEFADRRLGILNLDAHFDLRQAVAPSSGTPFLQIALDRMVRGASFDYSVIGISEPNNTTALFDTARQLQATWLRDIDAQTVPEAVAHVDEFVARVDDLYLTIDLDVMPAAQAPGVSAPAGLGVPAHVILAAASAAARSGKLRHFDIVELNPSCDIDGRTARIAARLVNEILTTAAGRPAGP
ncbi:formimidoylglutamase [Brevibacterium daeguense]|uniref:Formimidoylglutamase n=1 Tax=Brevibacterium daeguense TaxID=909936 RepID=A0ABP8EFE8_9MICO|nr:arginase family protein [Brevibacterium daeguense]